MTTEQTKTEKSMSLLAAEAATNKAFEETIGALRAGRRSGIKMDKSILTKRIDKASKKSNRIVKGLRSNGEGCRCEAYGACECGCDGVIWAEHVSEDAASMIEHLIELLSIAKNQIPDDKTI